MGFFAMSNIGMAPIGNLWIGSLAEKYGAPKALLYSSSVGVLIAGLFCFWLFRFKTVKVQNT
jgi:hypothetical protein